MSNTTQRYVCQDLILYSFGTGGKRKRERSKGNELRGKEEEKQRGERKWKR